MFAVALSHSGGLSLLTWTPAVFCYPTTASGSACLLPVPFSDLLAWVDYASCITARQAKCITICTI